MLMGSQFCNKDMRGNNVGAVIGPAGTLLRPRHNQNLRKIPGRTLGGQDLRWRSNSIGHDDAAISSAAIGGTALDPTGAMYHIASMACWPLTRTAAGNADRAQDAGTTNANREHAIPA